MDRCLRFQLPERHGSFSTVILWFPRQARTLRSSLNSRVRRSKSTHSLARHHVTFSHPWLPTLRTGSHPWRCWHFQATPSPRAWGVSRLERRSTTSSTRTIPRRPSRSSGLWAAKVILVGLPADASASLSQNSSGLNQIYQSLTKNNPGVTYDDAGQAVTASGPFTWTLPCLSGEPCTGPDGTNIVRAPDGVHFCPNGETTLIAGFEKCDVYSSGAFRFASAMLASALTSSGLSKAVRSPPAPCGSEPVHVRRMTAGSKRRAPPKECRTR